MQIIHKNREIANFIFMVGVCLELLVMVTDHFSSWTLPYRGRVTHVAFVMFCVKILMTYYDKTEWVLMILSGILGFVSYITSGDEYVIRAVVFLFAAKYIDVVKVFKIVLIGTSIFAIIIVFLALSGVCGNVSDIRHYGRGIVEKRYVLGFNHANNVHDMLWYLCSLYILIKGNDIKWKHCAIMTIINIIAFVLTRSRTGFIVLELIIVLVMVLIYTSKKWVNCMVYMMSQMSLALVVFLTIYGSKYNIYDRKIVMILNKYLNGRMEMLTEYANFKYWELFPISRSAQNVDNGFSVITYNYGTLIGLLFVALVVIELSRFYRNKNMYAIVVLLGTILVTFMESTFVINVSLLCNMILLINMLGYNQKDGMRVQE